MLIHVCSEQSEWYVFPGADSAITGPIGKECADLCKFLARWTFVSLDGVCVARSFSLLALK